MVVTGSYMEFPLIIITWSVMKDKGKFLKIPQMLKDQANRMFFRQVSRVNERMLSLMP